MNNTARQSDIGPLMGICIASVILAIALAITLFVLVLGGREPDPPAPVSTKTAAKVEDLQVRARALTAPPSLAAPSASAPVPRWIWDSDSPGDDEHVTFVRSLTVTPNATYASLSVTADNHVTVRVNGEDRGTHGDWGTILEVDLTTAARTGQIDLELEAVNDGGPGGLIALVEWTDATGQTSWDASGTAWQVRTDDGMIAATDLGELGMSPWGGLPIGTTTDVDRAIQVLEGFDVELVYTVPRTQGSWVCLTTDERGRLIASAQYAGLYRITPTGIAGNNGPTLVEPIPIELGGAQGLCVVDGDLYAVVNGGFGEGPGVYRVIDTDDDDMVDTPELIRGLPGNAGEHGPHGIVQGPDGLLYLVAGNHVPLPEMERSRVPRVWAEDHLLPRLWDARGHAVGIMSPGGWIARFEPPYGSWELYAIGMRNSYDIDFDAAGELFTYDADMEWDMGAPWYRPTRILHVPSGAEYGWRSGTAKWPEHWTDSVPGIVDLGPGSPTGLLFGSTTSFPAPYGDALFALDWTYGTIYAIHLDPTGSTYTGEPEVFLTGRPLPLTDAVINDVDGAMYFAVGGRRTASAVYRIIATDPVTPTASATTATDATTLRRTLEAAHDPTVALPAMDDLVAALAHADRGIRYAARIALEHHDPTHWRDAVLTHADPTVRYAGAMALIRVDAASNLDAIVDSLAFDEWDDLPRALQLEWLRTWSLVFIRSGLSVDDARVQTMRGHLEAIYPTGDRPMDRDLCDLMVHVGSAAVVPRTIPLMESVTNTSPIEADDDLLLRGGTYGQAILRMAAAPPDIEQVHYALALRYATRGWNLDLRDRYFAWFDSSLHRDGGNSFAGFLNKIREDAIAQLPEILKTRYTTETPPGFEAIDEAIMPRGPGRAWSVADVEELMVDGMTYRNIERGRELFESTLCFACHRFAGAGNAGGPDLSGVGNRFSHRDLIEALVEPSRTISDQYAQHEFTLDDGSVVVGRIVDESDETISVIISMLTPDQITTIEQDRVVDRRVSTVSAMMPRLLDRLSPGEVRDLMVYLLSGGDERTDAYVMDAAGPWQTWFDGTFINGWMGDTDHWRLEDEVLIGEHAGEPELQGFSYIEHELALPRTFELRVEMRVIGDNNSGIQYLSRRVGPGDVQGFQCDVHPDPNYLGMVYETGGRAIVAEHGHRARISGDEVETEPIGAMIDFGADQWHEYTVIVHETRIEHRIDGHTVAEMHCDDPDVIGRWGDRLAFQLHPGAPCRVEIRSIRLRPLAE